MHIAMGGHGQAWPPKGYAGVERVGSWWVRELRARGHTVTLVADGRSTLEVDNLIPSNEQTYHEGFQKARDLGAEVVHDNNDAQEPNPGRWTGGPYVFTVHACVWRGNPQPIFLSRNQARWHGYQGEPVVVHNGLPAEEYPFCGEKEDFLLWCASIRDCKAPEMAVQLARETGLRLKIIGPIQDGQYNWLREHRSPDGQIHYLGEMDVERLDYYRRAAAFVYTCSDSWMEGFNLTNIEALLSGTPVVGLWTDNNRIVEEQLVHGRSGFICKGYEQMRRVLADRAYEECSPAEVRACGEGFDVRTAVDGYLAAYQRAIDGERW